MKKVTIFLFFVLISLTVLAANYEKNFLKNFQESVELNKSRFKDVNLVHPGDTVLVVKREVVPVIITAQDTVSKIHDCLWYAVMRTTKEPVTTQANTNDIPFFKSLKDNLVLISLLGLFMLLFILLVIALLRRPIVINNHFTGSSGNFTQTPIPENTNPVNQ